LIVVVVPLSFSVAVIVPEAAEAPAATSTLVPDGLIVKPAPDVVNVRFPGPIGTSFVAVLNAVTIRLAAPEGGRVSVPPDKPGPLNFSKSIVLCRFRVMLLPVALASETVDSAIPSRGAVLRLPAP
jgi:hypothetical protein